MLFAIWLALFAPVDPAIAAAGDVGPRLTLVMSPVRVEDSAASVNETDVEEMTRIFNALGLDMQVVVVPPGRVEQAVHADIQACALNMPRPYAELFSDLTWIGPLWRSSFTLFVLEPRADQFTNLRDAQGLRVGVVIGGVGQLILQAAGIRADAVRVDDLNLRKLNAGRIDAWFTFSRIGGTLAKRAGIPVRPAYRSAEIDVGLGCNPKMPAPMMAEMRKSFDACGWGKCFVPRADGGLSRPN